LSLSNIEGIFFDELPEDFALMLEIGLSSVSESEGPKEELSAAETAATCFRERADDDDDVVVVVDFGPVACTARGDFFWEEEEEEAATGRTAGSF
jgi:hypothetical protein